MQTPQTPLLMVVVAALAAFASGMLAVSTVSAQVAVSDDALKGVAREAAPPATDDPASTCSKGLYPVDSPVAGGGSIVDLQGRFKATVSAEKKADGSLAVRCSHGARADKAEQR